MEEKKSFWKRYEFIIIALITLLAIYLIIAFNQKINFFLGNEMVVYLTAGQESFSMHYGESSLASFNVSIDNFAYCMANCNYSFNDRSRNELIDKGSFEINKDQYFAKRYNLSIKRIGSGQDIYSFDVSCYSMRSFLCLTNGLEKSRSSLVTVNYDLTSTEKELKKVLKQNVTMLLEMLSEEDVLHQKVNQKYFELAHRANLNNLTKEKIAIDDEYDKLRISVENLKSLWSVENYVKLNQMFNESFFENLMDINTSIGNLNNGIDNIIGIHNELLLGLGKLSANLKHLEGFVHLIGGNETINETDAMVGNFNNASSSMTNNTFESYGDIIHKLAGIVENQTSIIEKTKLPAAGLFFDYEYDLRYENDLLCSLKQDCNENFSVDVVVGDTTLFLNGYPNITLVKNACNSLKGLNQTFSQINNGSLNLIQNKGIIFPNNDLFLNLTAVFKDNLIRLINNSYRDSFEKMISGNNLNPDIIKIANSTLPANKTDRIQIGSSQPFNISLYLLSQINLSSGSLRLLDECQKLDEEKEKIGNFDFNPVSTNITYDIVPSAEANLSDNPPICCVFNDCRPCCRDESCKNDPKTFPVIFLHGHSFSKDNSPEYSLDAFNKLQTKLQEDGYINAGIVSLYSKNEQMQSGIWGLSGKPVTVKVSYYYDAFRKDDKYIVVPTKSENIDTYALRLKDLIDIVKDRTNKPKVNIIAHSMGSLVARRYIQIFGDGDVDKLIMIAAPNKGITSDISSYCGVVGDNRECDDMKEDSIFINKLNDPSEQPKNVQMYNIIGEGCKMKSGNGDGVVTVQSAELANAKQFFINGTCNGIFGGTLHTELLNIDEYPQTYSIVKRILTD